MSNERGAIIIAYGDQARREAVFAIDSLRRHNADLPVSVVSDGPITGLRHIPSARQDAGARWQKVNLDTLSPYGDTLYLDADTRVNAAVNAGFAILADGWDMVITPCQNQERDWLWHVSEAERRLTLNTMGQALALQGGMFFFARNSVTQRFFSAWRAEWERFREQDQAALLRALYRAPVKAWLLGRPWNGGDEVVTHRFGMARERWGG